MKRALRGTALALGLFASACVGHASVGVTTTIDPRLLLPGATMHQEIAVEADGLLGNGIRQGLNQTTTASVFGGEPGWQVRDNSDPQVVRLRATRDVEVAPGSQTLLLGAQSGPSVHLDSQDYGLVRRYIVEVIIPVSSLSADQSGASTPATSSAIAASTYDQYLFMPGYVTATNGIPGDSGRLAWHVNLAATSDQTLTAESLYIDWPRVGLLVLLVAIATVLLLLRRMRSRRRAAVRAE